MKITILLPLIFSFSFGFKVEHPKQLPLLKARQNFNADILECVLNNPHQTYNVIILSINKIQNNTVKEVENYEIGMTLLDNTDFELPDFKENNYFGYFEYKKRIVLVYGDDGYKHFFLKRQSKSNLRFFPNHYTTIKIVR